MQSVFEYNPDQSFNNICRTGIVPDQLLAARAIVA